MILNSGTQMTPCADAKQDLMMAATILVKLSLVGVVSASQNTMMLAMAVTDASGPGASMILSSMMAILPCAVVRLRKTFLLLTIKMSWTLVEPVSN